MKLLKCLAIVVLVFYGQSIRVMDMTEEEQIQEAIRQSLGDQGNNGSSSGSQQSWNQVALSKMYNYPSNMGTNVYSTQFPNTPLKWFEEKDCPGTKRGEGTWRSTSIRWISDKITRVKGFSFKGLVYKQALGSRENEYAMFFHQERCYVGGGEYGWVFPEDTIEGFFYLCENCNLKDEKLKKEQQQKWFQWPGNPAEVSGDADYIKKALKNPAVYRYWNIKVTPEGNYILEVVDPVSWELHACTIKNPEGFPNLYNAQGYITINAKKETNLTAQPPAYMHVDEVKLWQ